MRRLLILGLSLVMFGCTTIKTTSSIDQSMKVELHHAVLTSNRNKFWYDASRAQLAWIQVNIEKRSKVKDIPAYGLLERRFNDLEKLNKRHQDKSSALQKYIKTYQAPWEGKSQITSDEPEWNSYTKLDAFMKKEKASLASLDLQMAKAKLNFDKVRVHKTLNPYTKNIPTSRSKVKSFLKKVDRYYAAKKAQEEKKREQDRFDKQYLSVITEGVKSPPTDFEALVKLIGLENIAFRSARKPTSMFSQPSEPARTKGKKQLYDVINPVIIKAAQTFAENETSVNVLKTKLRSLTDSKYHKLVRFISNKNRLAINAIFQKQRSLIISRLLPKELEKSKRIVFGTNSPKKKLRQLVALHTSFSKTYSTLSHEPTVKAHFVKLQNHRLRILASIEPKIIASIKATKTPSKFKTPLAGLIVKEDRSSQVVRRIMRARKAHLITLMVFKPVSKSSDLSFNSFTSKGLNYETELLALYLGDFKNSRLEPKSSSVNSILGKYLYAYGKQCNAYLPSNKVPITNRKCASERVTTNGYGTVTNTTCVRWVDVPTGLYADPALYNTYTSLSGALSLTTVGKVLFSGDMFAGRSIADELLSVGNDMTALIKKNRCSNAGLERFETNLHNFIKGRSPVRLPDRETIASLRSVDLSALVVGSINFKKLIDHLIKENSKNWVMNRYRSGSVSSVSAQSTNRNGSPQRVTASYTFNTMGNASKGKVTLSFQNHLPKCLYFSDAPRTCRHPSRRVINGYENGYYLK